MIRLCNQDVARQRRFEMAVLLTSDFSQQAYVIG